MSTAGMPTASYVADPQPDDVFLARGWSVQEIARWRRAEQLRVERSAEWNDPRHRGCCWRCGWHVSGHGISAYGLDCPNGVSPAAEAGHLPDRRPA